MERQMARASSPADAALSIAPERVVLSVAPERAAEAIYTTSKSAPAARPPTLVRQTSGDSVGTAASSDFAASGPHRYFEETIVMSPNTRVTSMSTLEKVFADEDWFSSRSFIACVRKWTQDASTNPEGCAYYPLLLIHGWHVPGKTFKCSKIDILYEGERPILQLEDEEPTQHKHLVSLSDTPQQAELEETEELTEVGEVFDKVLTILKHNLFIYADALPKAIVRSLASTQPRGRGRSGALSDSSRTQHTTSRANLPSASPAAAPDDSHIFF